MEVHLDTGIFIHWNQILPVFVVLQIKILRQYIFLPVMSYDSDINSTQ